MEIDLRKVKTVCISLKTSIKRRENISRMMEKLSFENWSFFDGLQTWNPVDGCARSHSAVLNGHNFTEPMLVLEDDVEFTSDYSHLIEVPENTDALYLGYSWWPWATHRAKSSVLEAETSVEKIGNWFKIKRMTSAHAILYLTSEYGRYVEKSILDYLVSPDGNGHCDVAMAKAQELFNVIAPPKPFFFQMCERNSFWTNKSLQEYSQNPNYWKSF